MNDQTIAQSRSVRQLHCIALHNYQKQVALGMVTVLESRVVKDQ